MITLITPIKVVTSLAGTTAVFGILTLNFLPIPEPGTLLLLGSGIAGLAVLGRKKQRNR